jgi:hypothetical protein
MELLFDILIYVWARGKLYCALTCSVMSKNWAGVANHIEGYRYRKAKGNLIFLGPSVHLSYVIHVYNACACMTPPRFSMLGGVCCAELLDQGQTQLMEEPELASSEVFNPIFGAFVSS